MRSASFVLNCILKRNTFVRNNLDRYAYKTLINLLTDALMSCLALDLLPETREGKTDFKLDKRVKERKNRVKVTCFLALLRTSRVM